MKYSPLLVLFIVTLFQFVSIGIGKSAHMISPISPSRPTGQLDELDDKDIGSPTNTTGIRCDISPRATTRVAPRNKPGSTWEYFLVYMSPSFSKAQRDMVQRAIDELSKVICILLAIFPTGLKPYGDYVNITSDENSCSTDFGRLGGEQTMNLGPNCWAHSMVLRALLQSLGLQPEHLREDRDDFVTIHWENIKQEYKFAFEKVSIPTYGVPYNTRSIMHYPSYAFSKNGRPTITTKNGSLIPTNDKLTDSDKEMLRRMYKCS